MSFLSLGLANSKAKPFWLTASITTFKLSWISGVPCWRASPFFYQFTIITVFYFYDADQKSFVCMHVYFELVYIAFLLQQHTNKRVLPHRWIHFFNSSSVLTTSYYDAILVLLKFFLYLQFIKSYMIKTERVSFQNLSDEFYVILHIFICVFYYHRVLQNCLYNLNYIFSFIYKILRINYKNKIFRNILL